MHVIWWNSVYACDLRKKLLHLKKKEKKNLKVTKGHTVGFFVCLFFSKVRASPSKFFMKKVGPQCMTQCE